MLTARCVSCRVQRMRRGFPTTILADDYNIMRPGKGRASGAAGARLPPKYKSPREARSSGP